jgi:hypothetical protein
MVVILEILFVACIAQWLKWRRIDLMILASRVQIPLWKMGVGLSMRSCKRGPVSHKPSLLKAMSIKRRLEICSPVTGSGDSRQIAGKLLVQLHVNKKKASKYQDI